MTNTKRKSFKKTDGDDLSLASARAYAQPIDNICLTPNLEEVKASYAYKIKQSFGFSVAFKNYAVSRPVLLLEAMLLICVFLTKQNHSLRQFCVLSTAVKMNSEECNTASEKCQIRVCANYSVSKLDINQN